MILEIITTILSFLGILGYYFNIPIWLIIGMIAAVVQIIVDVRNKNLKNTVPFLLAYALGTGLIKDSWLIGMSVGLCYGNTIMNFITFFFILKLKEKTNINKKEKSQGEKKKNNKIDKNIICSIVIAAGLVIIVILSMWFKSHEAKLKREYEINKIKEEDRLREKKENDRRSGLNFCVDLAEANRNGLWKTNDYDGDGKLNRETINWIEKRYQSDIDICRSKYK